LVPYNYTIYERYNSRFYESRLHLHRVVPSPCQQANQPSHCTLASSSCSQMAYYPLGTIDDSYSICQGLLAVASILRGIWGTQPYLQTFLLHPLTLELSTERWSLLVNEAVRLTFLVNTKHRANVQGWVEASQTQQPKHCFTVKPHKFVVGNKLVFDAATPTPYTPLKKKHVCILGLSEHSDCAVNNCSAVMPSRDNGSSQVFFRVSIVFYAHPILASSDNRLFPVEH